MALGATDAIVGFLAYYAWKLWKGKGAAEKAPAKAPWPKDETPLAKQAEQRWKEMTPKEKAKAVKATKGEGGFGTDEEALLEAARRKKK